MYCVGLSRDSASTNDFFVLKRVESLLAVEFDDPRGVTELVAVKNELAGTEEFRGLLFHPRRRITLEHAISYVAVYNVSDVVLVGPEPVSKDSESLDDCIVSGAVIIDEFKSKSGEGFSGDSGDVTDKKDFSSTETRLAKGDGVVSETGPAITFSGSDDDIVRSVHSFLIKLGVQEWIAAYSASAMVARYSSLNPCRIAVMTWRWKLHAVIVEPIQRSSAKLVTEAVTTRSIALALKKTHEPGANDPCPPPEYSWPVKSVAKSLSG